MSKLSTGLWSAILLTVGATSCSADDSLASLSFNTDCEDCVSMQIVPADSFEMGAYLDYGDPDMAGPTFTVHIAEPFAVATHEVTVGQFQRFTQQTGYVSKGICNVYTDTTSWHINPDINWDKPGFPQEENHPVLCVSWNDTQAYISWLNTVTGNNYRLPTESEWEYIATTGGLGSGPDGTFTHEDGNIGKVECCGGATSGRDTWYYTAPVGSFSADKYGLYDIRGNAWEWQADCFDKTHVGAPTDGSARTNCEQPEKKVTRGGSYGDAGAYLSPRFRVTGPRDIGYFTLGFRLAHSIKK